MAHLKSVLTYGSKGYVESFLMRIMALVLTLLLIFVLPVSANASPKPWAMGWWPSHWKDQDFQPHLDDPKSPHNSQWQAEWSAEHGWNPQDWIALEGSAEAVLKNFYALGVIREQDEDGDVPVLIVGDAFMNLSGQEKRRVAEFLDYVYGITARPENGLFYIYYDRTHKLFWRGEPIGVYTVDGLQLQ